MDSQREPKASDSALNDNPTVAPGGQVKIRYVYEIPTHVQRFKAAKVIEYRSRPVVADISQISALVSSGESAEPSTTPGNAVPLAKPEFALVDDLDVRVDAVRWNRSGMLEAFLSIKTPTAKVQTLSASTLKISVADADVVAKRSVGNLYKVTGEEPEVMSHNLDLAPGGEGKVRLVFDIKASGLRPTRLTVKGYRPPTRVFPLPSLPAPQ